jgi:putative glutamine amidotransferase
VQWHPEENREDRRLFAGLVEQAAAYADTRMRTVRRKVGQTA